MPCFEEQFIISKGQPIEHMGETVFLADTVSVNENFRIKVRLIFTNSEWVQVIQLRVNKGGYLLCAGKKNAIFQLAENTMPTETEISGYAKDGKLIVNNAWTVKDCMGADVTHSWHNGAAMKKTVEGSAIRYYCNDGHPDENFDDLVFEIILQP